MTVPETTWLILYLMLKTAWIAASSIDESMPASKPKTALCVRLPTNAAIIDAINIIPSIAMLTVPERSANIPENAAKVMGIANNTALESMPAKLSDLPLACQIKKLKMSNNPHTPTTVLVASPKPLIS